MVFKRSLLFLASMSLGLTGFADTLRLTNGVQVTGTFEGGTSRIIRFRTDSGVQEYDILMLSSLQITDTSAVTSVESETADSAPQELSSSFGPEEEHLIREWFSAHANYSNLPPGLARRDRLPPGLQRQLQRNGTLPPGLQRRVQPLPMALERELPPTVDGLRRVILAGNVILLEEATARIIDLIRNVF